MEMLGFAARMLKMLMLNEVVESAMKNLDQKQLFWCFEPSQKSACQSN